MCTSLKDLVFLFTSDNWCVSKTHKYENDCEFFDLFKQDNRLILIYKEGSCCIYADLIINEGKKEEENWRRQFSERPEVGKIFEIITNKITLLSKKDNDINTNMVKTPQLSKKNEYCFVLEYDIEEGDGEYGKELVRDYISLDFKKCLDYACERIKMRYNNVHYYNFDFDTSYYINKCFFDDGGEKTICYFESKKLEIDVLKKITDNIIEVSELWEIVKEV